MELPSMPPYAASKLWPAVSGFQVDDKFIFLVVISELWTGCNCSTPYPTIPSLSPTPTSLDSFSMRSFYENRGQVATGIEAQKGGILRRENVLTSIGSCTKLCYTHISFYVVCVQVWVCGGKLIRNPRKTSAQLQGINVHTYVPSFCAACTSYACTRSESGAGIKDKFTVPRAAVSYLTYFRSTMVNTSLCVCERKWSSFRASPTLSGESSLKLQTREEKA